MRLNTMFGLAFAAALTVFSPTGQAQTLDAIVKRGKILVGIDLTVPPYGMTDEKGQPAGSDVDTANLLAKDLGVQLEIVPVTQPNRIPYLLTNRIDVIMSTFSITAERAKTITYSNPYGVIQSVILASANVSIKDATDLKGHRISVTRGSITDQSLTRAAPPGTTILRFDDEAGSQAAFVSGQADATSIAGAIATALIKQYPDRNFEQKLVLTQTFYSIGIRRNDPDMVRWLNTFIFLNQQSGNLAAIYQRFFSGPLPVLPSF